MEEERKRLKIHENKRSLCWENGDPFYYLGDTAWELFHRLKKAEIAEYLDVRQEQGFTVIQAVALGEFEGVTTPNAYGFLPFQKNGETILTDCPQEEYWKHVDWSVEEMQKRNLFVGMLPAWGDKFNLKWGKGPEIFEPDNAYRYGKWIGKRYRDHWNILWILGGDRPLEDERHRKIIDAMAKGIREEDKAHLITFHPCGACSSVDFVKGKSYIDFHMVQSGHGLEGLESYKLLKKTREAEEKPFLDGEPRYEDHPACFKPEWGCYWDQEAVRQNLYWDMMEGSCGHTYGNHGIWGFCTEKNEYYPITWREALYRPGAEQMKYGKRLRLSRDYFSFMPCEELVEENDGFSGHLCAGKGKDYAYIYIPYGQPVKADLSILGNGPIRLSWYDPRNGEEKIDKILPSEKMMLYPPKCGKGNDWIAILDIL